MTFILITLFFIIFFRLAIKHKFLKNEDHIEYYKLNWEGYDLSDKPFEKSTEDSFS